MKFQKTALKNEPRTFLGRCSIFFLWTVGMFCFMGSSGGDVYAQTVNDVALRGLRNVHQNSFINPSWLPDTNIFGEHRASTGFHIGGDIRSNYLVINDLLRSLNANNDIQVLKLIIPPLSTFAYTGITAAAGAGMTTMLPLNRRGLYLTLGYQVRGQAAVNIDGTEIASYRTGSKVDINKTLARAMTWGELSVGFSGRYRALSYGVRVKYLMGIGYANLYLDGAGFDRKDGVALHINKAVFSSSYYGANGVSPFSPPGHGVSVDLGATVKVSKKTSIDVSVLDLGFIAWDQATPSQAVNNQTFNVRRLVGAPYSPHTPPTKLADLFYARNSDLEHFNFATKDSLNTTSVLPLYWQFSLGVTHIFNEHWMIGGIYHTSSSPAAFKYAVSVYGSYRFFRNWEVTLNTGLREGVIRAVGMGLAYTGRTFQAFVTTENLMAMFNTYDSRNFHILLGVNFRMANRSLKISGKVDRILCSDPIVDEEEQTKRLERRKGIAEDYQRSGKDGQLRYSEKYPNGLLNYGEENEPDRKYKNPYSEIIGEEGEKGGNFDRIEYIDKKLQERELPLFNPKPVIPQRKDQTINKGGAAGGFYNEKYVIPLPKTTPEGATQKPASFKRGGKELNYGQSGGDSKLKAPQKNIGSGYGKGGTRERKSSYKGDFGSKGKVQKKKKINYR